MPIMFPKKLGMVRHMSVLTFQCIDGDKNIENTGLVSFDIKFTRQGFENAC